jgi:hypothetical protein
LAFLKAKKLTKVDAIKAFFELFIHHGRDIQAESPDPTIKEQMKAFLEALKEDYWLLNFH